MKKYALILTLVILMLAICQISTAAEVYQFSGKWGSDVISEGKWSVAADILVDDDGFIYISDWGNNRIQKLDSNGNCKKTWSIHTGRTWMLYGSKPEMAFNNEGKIFIIQPGHDVTEKYRNQSNDIFGIRIYDRDGNYLGNWEGFTEPSNIAFSMDGFGYIDNRGINEWQISKVDGQGKPIINWTLSQDPSENYRVVHDIAVDRNGYVYILSNRRPEGTGCFSWIMEKFDSNGQLIDNWSSFNNYFTPGSILLNTNIDPIGNVYVIASNENSNEILVFDTNGTFKEKFGENFYQDPISDMSFDKNLNVYAITDDAEIRIFASNGDLKQIIDPVVNRDGELLYPQHIVIDALDNVYIGDSERGIQKFDKNGSFIMKWDVGPLPFAIDPSGNLYIMNSTNKGNWCNETYSSFIEKYDNKGNFIKNWTCSGQFIGDLAIDQEGYLYVIESRESDNGNLTRFVEQFDFEGESLDQWPLNGEGIRIAVHKGFVYVLGSGAISMYSRGGSLVNSFPYQFPNEAYTTSDRWFAIDSKEKFYIADDTSVLKYNTNLSRKLAGFGQFGTANGEFSWISGIAVDSSGKVYISDKINCLVQTFNKSDENATSLKMSLSKSEDFYRSDKEHRIKYTITYENVDSEISAENVILSDFISPYVDIVEISDSGIFNPVSRIVTWNLGTVRPSEKGMVTLTVKLSDTAADTIINRASITTSTADIPFDNEGVVSTDIWQFLTGFVSVTSTPSGAEIYLDGYSTGLFTPADLSILSGSTHEIRLKLSGYKDSNVTVILQRGDRKDISATLVPSDNRPDIIITSGLTISGRPQVGEKLTGSFSFKNNGSSPVTLNNITIGGRYSSSSQPGDGKLPNGEYPDFTHRPITVLPGELYLYKEELLITQAGHYHFFCEYSPYPGDPSIWNSNMSVLSSEMKNQVDIEVKDANPEPTPEPTPNPDSTPIVLIHGLSSDPSVWTSFKTKLEEENIPVWLFDYQKVNQESPVVSAQLLSEYIAKMRKETGYTGKVDLVCHSMGGLVSRWYIEKLGGEKEVRQWIGIAPPTHGASIADFSGNDKALDKLGHIIAGNAIDQLRSDSDVVKGLKQDVTQDPIIYHVIVGINSKQERLFGYDLIPELKNTAAATGFFQWTRVTFENKGSKDFGYTYIGDGIVAVEQSKLTGASLDYFEGLDHAELLNAPDVITRVLEYHNNPEAKYADHSPDIAFQFHAGFQMDIFRNSLIIDINKISLNSKEKIESIDLDFGDATSHSNAFISDHKYLKNMKFPVKLIAVLNTGERIESTKLLDLPKMYESELASDIQLIFPECPVSLNITDSNNRTLSKWTAEIPNATYLEKDINSDGKKEDFAFIPNPIGDYRIVVVPDLGAKPNETYSIISTRYLNYTTTNTTNIANNITIVNIPSEPYRVITVPPPNINFSANITNGDSPLIVGFTDLSTNKINKWQWEFGDGTGSEDRNPVHTYSSSGTFNVTLIAGNEGGSGIFTRQNYISISSGTPQNPHLFYGNSTIGGIPAPISSMITVSSESEQGSLNITKLGTYGIPLPDEPKLKISGIKDGTPLYFFVNGQSARCNNGTPGSEWADSFPFKSNSVTHLDLDVPASLSAEFAGEPLYGTVPLRVNFTDTSIGGPTKWVWDFGDGKMDTLSGNPNHTYYQPGKYTVGLRIEKMSANDSTSKLNYIVVNDTDDALKANFSGAPRSGVNPLSVTFKDLSSGNPDTWNWSFGDNSTSNEQNPIHTYSVSGLYTVELTASRGKEISKEEKINFVIVSNPPPIGGDVGYYLIHCNINGAQVYFDNDFKGNISNGLLNASIYISGAPYQTITVKMNGYNDYIENLNIRPSKDETIDVYTNLSPSGFFNFNFNFVSFPSFSIPFPEFKEFNFSFFHF